MITIADKKLLYLCAFISQTISTFGKGKTVAMAEDVLEFGRFGNNFFVPDTSRGSEDGDEMPDFIVSDLLEMMDRELAFRGSDMSMSFSYPPPPTTTRAPSVSIPSPTTDPSTTVTPTSSPNTPTLSPQTPTTPTEESSLPTTIAPSVANPETPPPPTTANASVNPSAALTTSPTLPPSTNPPTTAPTSPATTPPTNHTTLTPTIPITTISPTPVSSPSPSTATPTVDVFITTGPTTQTQPVLTDPVSVFQCNSDTQDFLAMSHVLTYNETELTIVAVDIEYVVEATTDVDNFTESLNLLIMSNAVMASLECGISFIPITSEFFLPLNISTNVTDSCNATIENTTCYVMETQVSYILDEDELNEATAMFLAHSSLEDDMKDFASRIRGVERVEYLGPNPVAPLDMATELEPTLITSSARTSLAVNTWAIASCVAMSTGGLIALVVWARNRRTRHRRHVQLLEDVSMEPSLNQQTPQQQQREVVTAL